jgi:hypothetical protein
MMNKAISSCGGAVLDDFTETNQTKLENFDGRHKALMYMAIPNNTSGDTSSQNQEDWWNARQMEERGIFFPSCKTTVSMIATVLLGVCQRWLILQMKFKFNQKQKEELKR